jgi:hypothetical protein
MSDSAMSALSQRLHALRELVDERDVRYQQRYDASQKALDAALLSADRAVQAALLAAKEAVTKAELSADKRFELLNELRIGVATTDQLDALEKLVAGIADRVTLAEGRLSGSAASRAGIYAAIAAVGVVITVVVLIANAVFR